MFEPLAGKKWQQQAGYQTLALIYNEQREAALDHPNEFKDRVVVPQTTLVDAGPCVKVFACS